jgi:hypothetical protein
LAGTPTLPTATYGSERESVNDEDHLTNERKCLTTRFQNQICIVSSTKICIMKNALFTLFTICTGLLSFCQSPILLSNQNGFEIAYKAQKLEEGKKDKWLVTVTAINKTDKPLYYALATMKQKDGSWAVGPFETVFSSKVEVRNATGFLSSDGVKIKGETSDLFTENKTSILYKYDAGRIYNYENTINVKHGDTPIITVSHFYPLKVANEFNMEASSALIDGDYKTTCGQMMFSLLLQDRNNRAVLIQSINGKQIKWIKTSATLFTKENDTNTTLSYNKEKKVFSYSSSDGVNCEWSRN